VRIEADQVLWSVPESERAGRPLLVLLHGHGMNERIGFELRHELPSSLVIASLRGPLRARAGYGWFPLDASFSLGHVASAVAAVLSWLDEQPDDHSSVGLLGFSQGSAIAVQCLRERPMDFVYAVVLSGFMNPLPARGDRELARIRPPVFSGRGAADALVPRPLVVLTERWLGTHATLTSKVYPGLGHNVSNEEIKDLAAFLNAQLMPPQT
jgi:phospholipase/carboxylesterase